MVPIHAPPCVTPGPACGASCCCCSPIWRGRLCRVTRAFAVKDLNLRRLALRVYEWRLHNNRALMRFFNLHTPH